MDRRDEILAFIMPEMEKQFTKRTEEILVLCEENAEQFVAACLAPFVELFARCNELQSKGEKEEIHYLCISRLLSSIITGSYQLRLDIYDYQFLLDEKPVTLYWTVPYIFDSFSYELHVMEEVIKKKFIRLKPFEMQHIRMAYAEYHFGLIAQLMKDLVDYIRAFGEPIQKAKEYKILFGELWGEYTTIFPIEG
jgi:hypothetical protein